MYSLNKVKTLVSCGRDPARSLPLRRGFLLIPLILGCFAFAPQTRAQGGGTCLDGCDTNFGTFQGQDALNANFGVGAGNSAFGWRSLFFNTANFNSGFGGGTLALNNADSNTAVGAAALLLNGDGTRNTAVGTDALVFNGFGVSGADFNGAFGAFALFSNSTGFSNNAMGDSALFSNVAAAANTAIGDLAAAFNDSDGLGLANNNVAVGAGALVSSDGTTGNIDGSENTAVGTGAGPNLVTGFNNTYLGNFVGSVDEFGSPLPDESSTIRIGDLSNGNGAGSLDCFIGGIFNNEQPVGGTVVEVTIDLANDHLGWQVEPGANRPVLKRGVPAPRAPRGLQQPGAQPQRQAMLNDKVEKLQATVTQQQKQIDTLTAQLKEQGETLTAQLKEQAAQIQRVSAQLEIVKPAPRVVENP